MNVSDQGNAIAFLRISIGVLFLIFAEYKLAGTQFIWGEGIISWLTRVIHQGAYPFMLPFLRGVALPHSVFFGTVVSLSELLIAISLISGIAVRASSFGGLMMMLVFLFSADYPGSTPAFWNYFGASLHHCALSVCFVSLMIGGKCTPWSLRLPLRKT